VSSSMWLCLWVYKHATYRHASQQSQFFRDHPKLEKLFLMVTQWLERKMNCKKLMTLFALYFWLSFQTIPAGRFKFCTFLPTSWLLFLSLSQNLDNFDSLLWIRQSFMNQISEKTRRQSFLPPKFFAIIYHWWQATILFSHLLIH